MLAFAQANIQHTNSIAVYDYLFPDDELSLLDSDDIKASVHNTRWREVHAAHDLVGGECTFKMSATHSVQ